MPIERRQFCTLLATGLTTPFIMTACGGSSGSGGNGQLPGPRGAGGINPKELVQSQIGIDFPEDTEQSIFDLSIASGDPTPTGVMLWTHLAPSAVTEGIELHYQVAYDDQFEQLVLEGFAEPGSITEQNDFTVKIDLDGYLQPNRRYYYRFIYTPNYANSRVTSRVGRCRTTPAEDAQIKQIKFGLLTCQDYTNGYYGVLRQVAEDESLDFVIHLGDFIYDSSGGTDFQPTPHEDRRFSMLSEYHPNTYDDELLGDVPKPKMSRIVLDLADFRHIYRVYRKDQNLQRAMERHTWIMTADDHEIGNDAYWDYERNTLGLPDHPYTTSKSLSEGQIIQKLNQLKLDSQQSWWEYTPTRVTINRDSTDPHNFLKIYRRLVFGDMLELLMIDSRTYRTAHPCGSDQAFNGRYLPLTCGSTFENPYIDGRPHSMLGIEQKEWLFDHLLSSTRRYKVLGNQTLMARLGIEHKNWEIPFSVESWDGFQFERSELMQALKSHQVENFVVLTGDFHSHIAANLKMDYRNSNANNEDNYVGVEFMTPAITSSALVETASFFLNKGEPLSGQQQKLLELITQNLAYITNPHIRYFNSAEQGFSTLLFTPTYVEWESFVVDKDIPDNMLKKQVAKMRKYTSNPWLTPAKIENK
jgi:alkaline phosphatase D